MSWLSYLANRHPTLRGLLVGTVLSAIAAYSFASLAIDRGSLWYYLATFATLWAAVDSFVKLVKFKNGKK